MAYFVVVFTLLIPALIGFAIFLRHKSLAHTTTYAPGLSEHLLCSGMDRTHGMVLVETKDGTLELKADSKPSSEYWKSIIY